MHSIRNLFKSNFVDVRVLYVFILRTTEKGKRFVNRLQIDP